MFSSRLLAISSISRHGRLPFICGLRGYSQHTEGEKKIKSVLETKFPKASIILVEDISGGCGAMYEIKIESEEFAGLRKVKQHMMVNEALKEEIKDMHGLRINTLAPK